MSVPQRSQEPVKIAAGDTISFVRGLDNFLPTAGWFIKYEVRGGTQVIEFESVAQGLGHAVLVPSATTAAWLPGRYVLVGYAENTGTGERERVYYNNLEIAPNLEGSQGDVNVLTHNERMVALIQAVQEGAATNNILVSEVEQTRIQRLTPQQLREELTFWEFRVQAERRRANAQAERASGRNRLIQFVDPAAAGVNQFGALPPIYPNVQGQT